MIDPEFWSDEEIGTWSFQARLFYIGLWNFSDDEGRFKAHESLLKSQIFPYDKTVNIQSLKKELNNKIQWYEVEGLQYGFIRNLLKYQRIDRPTESKLPPPPPFDEPSTNPRQQLAPNIREVKLREDKVSKDNTIVDTDFIYKLRKLYLWVDLETELKKMDAWLLANPARKKTRRFIINWLNRIKKPTDTQNNWNTEEGKL